MKRVGALLVLMAPLLSPDVSWPCSCFSTSRAFLEVAKASQLVARARVLSYGERAATDFEAYVTARVETVDVIRGQGAIRELTIQGDTGILCRVYITPERFRVGYEYIFAFEQLKGESAYEISSCGTHWLHVAQDKAIGRLHGQEEESMEYGQL